MSDSAFLAPTSLSDSSPFWFVQIKVLNMLNQERAETERKEIIYMMEQRAALEREEALRTQVLLTTHH